jgi:hypothetical protein
VQSDPEPSWAAQTVSAGAATAAEELQEKSMKKSSKGISTESAQSKKDMKKKPVMILRAVHRTMDPPVLYRS